MKFDQLVDRAIRAARLEPELYEEVEADTGATYQALAVVLLSNGAAGIGSSRRLGVEGLLVGSIVALVAWGVWAGLTYFIGTQFFPGERTESDVGELLRTIGFSSSPGMLRLFGFVPILGPLIDLGTGIWMLVAMVIAVRQALDYRTTGRAVLVCFVGWLVQLSLLGLLYAA